MASKETTGTNSQPNATTFTPEDLVIEVLAGRIRVPSFQRIYRWQWEDVRRLFESIAKGYPIGNLLLWDRPAPAERVRVGALEIAGKKGAALYVIDGQQRITSLANALTEEGAQDPRFALAYNLQSEKFQRIEQDAPAHVVPLPVIFDLQRLLSWFADRPELDRKLTNRASQLTKVIRQYAIPAYVVTQQDEQILRDIFDRMNNYGRRLSRAEVFTALHGGTSKAGANLRFSDLAEDVGTTTGFGRIDDDTVLAAYLARRGGDVRRDIRAEFNKGVQRDFVENEEEAYRGAEAALTSAVKFLQESAGIPHFGFLPYRYLLIVLTRFFAHHPKPVTRNRELLRRFCWRAALTGTSVFRGWTNTVQALSTRITPDSASKSITKLLDAIGKPTLPLPRLEHFRTSTAETRTLLCALWSLHPMSPVEGAPYDVAAITSVLADETRATNALRTFFPRAPTTHRSWASNRAIVLDESVDDVGEAFVALRAESKFDASTCKQILRSHALDHSMLDLLDAGKDVKFLEARQHALAGVLRGFLEKMTEEKLEDTPPLDEFDLDDDEEARDDAIDT